MTAEVAVMNKLGVALAADSAVTIGDKIYNSVNKLFTLSKYHPIGIMVYGNSALLNVPWEIIIKIFRKKLQKKSFSKVEGYANTFISYLEDGNEMFTSSLQEMYFENTVVYILDAIRKQTEDATYSAIADGDDIDDEKIERIIDQKIAQEITRLEQLEDLPSIPDNYSQTILQKYNKSIKEIIEQIFNGFPISKKFITQTRKLIGLRFSKDEFGDDSSGIVISGFGNREIYPTLVEYKVEGIILSAPSKANISNLDNPERVAANHRHGTEPYV